MNSLPNGAIAVGFEGSWMRLQASYEYELEKAADKGLLRLMANETISQRAEKMLRGLMTRTATMGESLKAAAVACGIRGNEKAIREYLVAADPQRMGGINWQQEEEHL